MARFSEEKKTISLQEKLYSGDGPRWRRGEKVEFFRPAPNELEQDLLLISKVTNVASSIALKARCGLFGTWEWMDGMPVS